MRNLYGCCDAYSIGSGAGMVVGLATGGTVTKLGLKSLRAAANHFDDAGRCGNALTKLWHGGCFVPGTLVTVSQLPYSSARQAALWNQTDWLDPVGQVANLSEAANLSEHCTLSQSSPLSQSYPLSLKSRSNIGHAPRSFILDETPQSALFTLQPSAARHPETSNLLQIPIEHIPLGARIPTENPRPWEYDDSLPEPNETTWAKLSIAMYRTDGGIVDAEMLRPRWWIEQNGIEAGKLLPMSIEELQVKGSALVTSIDDCPEIAGGEGSVVTARFCTREVHTIAQVEILGPDGQIETISGTPIHPIWSEDRQDWVPLGELEPGEQLRSLLPSPRSGRGIEGEGHSLSLGQVLSVTILNQPVPVYNIEVHGEHVYQVGELGWLVHNAPLACVAIGKAGEIAGGTTGPRIGLKSILNPGRWRFPDEVNHVAKTITETKNVARQSLTKQLRDYVKIAEDQGYQLILQVRQGKGTKISGPLQDLINRGRIALDPRL